MANKQTLFCGTVSQYLSKDLIKEADENNGGTAFRIPALINANGTLIAAVDKASTGADWGFIELAVRTSKDGGKTWDKIKTIATPPARVISTSIDNIATAFYIDPCLALAPNGDVILLATYFPESKGMHDKKLLDKGKTAYANFDGETVPLIYDRDGNYYYVLKNGNVIDSHKGSTDYKVNFTDGELYKSDEYVGNIFLNGAKGKGDENNITTYGAPLKAVKRSYVFMLKSSDNGETWSKPVDVTGMIINQSTDGVFLGVAPGNALTTKSGRIIFPLYTLNGSVCVYSDDNGNTWRRNNKVPFTPNIDEWTLAQGANDNLYAFSRAKKYGNTPVAVSFDNGLVWSKEKKAKVKSPKCQKNCLIDGETIYISHPSGKKRENGVISVGEFTYNKKGKLKGIKWSKNDMKINDGFFAYSCMTKVDNDTIGILYEDQPSSHIVFETIKVK